MPARVARAKVSAPEAQANMRPAASRCEPRICDAPGPAPLPLK